MVARLYAGLCQKHLDEVKGTLEGFATQAMQLVVVSRSRRRAASTGRDATRAARPAAAPRGESQAEIPGVGGSQGYAVGDRGRIPGEVRSAYEAAQSKGGRRR